MAKAIKAKYRVTFTPDFTEWPKTTIRRAQEKANVQAGQIWHRQLLPEHFKAGAERKYNYTQRDPKYQRRKGRQNKGVVLPLVGISRKGHRAGELKRQATRVARLSASTKRLTVKLTVPSYIKFRGRGGTGPDMVTELLTVSEREGRMLADRYGRRIAQELEREPKKKKFQNT